MKKREYLLSHEPIDFGFKQSKADFIVDEIPESDFKGSGNFLILLVKKTEMTTWDMVAAFAEYLETEAEKIGYAGLKDKHATTTQYLSFEFKHAKALKKFSHANIKILKTFQHDKNIRMGDLKGNRFTINLFDVDNIKAGKIEKIARKIEKNGLPNYFGYQRFGKDADSITQAQELIDGEIFVENTKVKNFLISVHQSRFFNEWLAERVAISKKEGEKFLLLDGDVMRTPEKLVTPKKAPQKDFEAKKIVPTGLLFGRDVFRAVADAREIEKKYDDEFFQSKGERRDAIVFPKSVTFKFDSDKSRLTISFELPKGSYATVFLEAIGNKELSAL